MSNDISEIKLYRLDETMWAFTPKLGEKEIRIVTPGYNDRALDYKLAVATAKFLKTGKDDSSELKNWEFKDCTKEWSLHLQDEGTSVIMHIMNRYQHFKELPYEVKKLVPTGKLAQISWLFSNTGKYIKSWFVAPSSTVVDTDRQQNQHLWNKEDVKNTFLKSGAFKDPFTELAQAVLQRDETPFISDNVCAGAYQFVLEGGQLKIEPIATSKGNSTSAVIAYAQFLKEAFGWRIIDKGAVESQIPQYGEIFLEKSNPEEQLFGYLKSMLEIDFDKMIRKGTPLLPDHVFKCNMAVNHLEMLQAESLFFRMNHLMKNGDWTKGKSYNLSNQFYEFFDAITSQLNQFSYREKRGICQSFKSFLEKQHCQADLSTFQQYLKSFQPIAQDWGQVRDMTAEGFGRLMEILTVDTHDVGADGTERFFTGRKIVHLGICGHKTMGNKNLYDPSRNLFELMHLFPSLEQKNEARNIELLAHVVAKKSLWSHHSPRPSELSNIPPANHQQKIRRVGKIIPFEGAYYYVDGLLNDGGGDVNYVLVPACKHYQSDKGKQLPLIKLYRSTASNAEAESSIDTILADVNPQRVGSLDFELGDDYEKAYFSRCSIPVWAAYLLCGDAAKAAEYFDTLVKPSLKNSVAVLENVEGYDTNFNQFVREHALKKESVDATLRAFVKEVGANSLKEFLTSDDGKQEWSRPKIKQDIYFTGHSLGGVLSQSGMHHFGPHLNRVPLPGCKYKCFAFDAPGVTLQESTEFLDFVNTHKKLLEALGGPWEIQFCFEKKDVVPQGGAVFLGVNTDKNKLVAAQDYVAITAKLFKVNSTDTDVVVTTIPTHGRRFEHLVDIGEHSEVLSLAELQEFKRGWWLSSILREKFGFSLARSPFLSDMIIRKGPLGNLLYAYHYAKKYFVRLRAPLGYEVDKKGVLHCTYNGYVN